jgi:hypothetical protein
MPEPGIILDPDQAEELRELITLTGIVQEWLHYAGDIILDNLADFAYHDTFHPRSYAAWLIQDLGCLSARLRKAAAPPATSHNSQHHDQAPAPPRSSPATITRSADSSAGALDTTASIGNQIPPSRLKFSQARASPGCRSVWYRPRCERRD